jgi:hypothetical protein
VQTAHLLDVSTESVDATLCPNDPNDYFEVPTVGENCEVTATLLHDWESGMNLRLVTYQSVNNPGVFANVGTDGIADLTRPALNDTFIIEVDDAVGNVLAPYTLEVDVQCDPPVEPGCPDAFEGVNGNDNRVSATNLGTLPVEGLAGQICENDAEDWFRFTTDIGCEVAVDLLFTDTTPPSDNSQNLDLRLWGSLLNYGSSWSSTSNESIIAPTREQVLWVEVYGYAYGQGPYILNITEDCTVDD